MNVIVKGLLVRNYVCVCLSICMQMWGGAAQVHACLHIFVHAYVYACICVIVHVSVHFCVLQQSSANILLSSYKY